MKTVASCAIAIVIFAVVLATDAGADSIYFLADEKVHRVGRDGLGLETVLDFGGGQGSRGFAIDPVNEMMYFQSTQQTDLAKLDGSNRQTFHGGGHDIEVAGDKVYVGSGHLVRYDLDGTNPFSPDPTINHVTGLAVAPSLNTIFFFDEDFGGTEDIRLRRMDLDGSNLQTLISWTDPLTQATPFSDLEVDPVGGKLYWTGVLPDYGIQMSNLDGTGQQTLMAVRL
jgi:hypothetical protein